MEALHDGAHGTADLDLMCMCGYLNGCAPRGQLPFAFEAIIAMADAAAAKLVARLAPGEVPDLTALTSLVNTPGGIAAALVDLYGHMRQLGQSAQSALQAHMSSNNITHDEDTRISFFFVLD